MSIFEKIIRRIISFPFILCVSLLMMFITWVKYMINFVRYGGEGIAYPENSKMIIDVYEKVQELINQKP